MLGGEGMVMELKEREKEKQLNESIIDKILKPFEEACDSMFLAFSKDEQEYEEREKFIKEGIKNS
jgi:hypothetical protein